MISETCDARRACKWLHGAARSLTRPLATLPFRLPETHGPEVANPPCQVCASYCDLHTAVRLRASQCYDTTLSATLLGCLTAC